MGKKLAFISFLLLASCGEPKQIYTYTLYRDSIIQDLRIHVATFNAVDNKESFNKGNCETAKNLFQSQAGVEVKYWCEKGVFKE